MTLKEINKKFGTDKGGKHCYLERYYEPTFSSIRESTKKLLEIGVYEGASIRLWREYFPSAEIFALEILQKRAGMFNDDSMVHLTIGSSTHKSAYENIPFDLDIIIDDGSHRPDDQYKTFFQAYQHLREGGLYIIEDVRDRSALQDLVSEYKDKLEIFDYSKEAEPDTIIFQIKK
jgi:hypothetical protein